MSDNVQNILAVLQELIDEHRQLVAYSHAKTEVIRKNDLEAISYISGKEKKIVQRIQELEQYRIVLVGKFAVEHKIRSQRTFSMDMIVQAVYHPELKRQLIAKWNDLSAAVKELQEVNEFNQTLVKMALEYVHFTQDLLLGPEEEDVTYHRAVQGMTANRSGRFNTRT